MEHVRTVVAERCGIMLRTEVRLLGFGGGETDAVPDPERPRIARPDVPRAGGAP